MTDIVLCFAPGPAVLSVVSATLGGGTGAGVRAAFGILAVNVGYFALSATGVGTILLASPGLFGALRWVGAAFLAWMGLRMVFRPSLAEPGGAPSAGSGSQSPFVIGLVTQGVNPKALVFFAALLPQFIDPAGSVPFQILILGVTSTLIELIVLLIYVGLGQGARKFSGRPGLTVSLHRAGGVLLLAAAAGLAALGRS
jgi:threonine/homoserine/homoserine lactone efflux protein